MQRAAFKLPARAMARANAMAPPQRNMNWIWDNIKHVFYKAEGLKTPQHLAAATDFRAMAPTTITELEHPVIPHNNTSIFSKDFYTRDTVHPAVWNYTDKDGNIAEVSAHKNMDGTPYMRRFEHAGPKIPDGVNPQHYDGLTMAPRAGKRHTWTASKTIINHKDLPQ
mmetsp:Transcript_52156/g.123346  ORF Transcript_52156/g.123346 Transcript_52156/m.123346 type:complete len:167 (+) Transcript_52156:3-503(+)